MAHEAGQEVGRHPQPRPRHAPQQGGAQVLGREGGGAGRGLAEVLQHLELVLVYVAEALLVAGVELALDGDHRSPGLGRTGEGGQGGGG